MSGTAIAASGLGKVYRMYERPVDRLKQMLFSRLGRQYGKEFWALKDVSFEVRKGQTVGIIGRNGSGKSTLLQLVCGTLSPSTGSVTTCGRVAALLELGSGFNPDFTGRENVYLNAGVLGLTRRQVEERFSEIVAFADIGDFIDQPVKTYSSGMLVRLAFAVVAHVDADILVIDEALAVGDAFFTQKCMRFLRSFMKNGTVLFVSHDASTVKNICDEAIWIERGQVKGRGTPREVCERYLEAFYEAQQGAGTTTRLKPPETASVDPRLKDQRAEFINASNLRNDLEIFAFNADSAAFGKGGAQITRVEFLDRNGAPLAWAVGGEQVILHVIGIANEPLDAPVVGFFIKDRLGQCLFGDNTYLSCSGAGIAYESGQEVHARFSFIMPILPTGDYSVSAAIANGTQEKHVQHHWLHDAIVFKVHATSVCNGLFGVQMSSIELAKT